MDVAAVRAMVLVAGAACSPRIVRLRWRLRVNCCCCAEQKPFHRRLAFDLGDVGIGQLTNSLELGCDCLGHIHYFDAVLNNSKGAQAPPSPVIPTRYSVGNSLGAWCRRPNDSISYAGTLRMCMRREHAFH